jgi:short-subunit dehydrogenase
VVVGGADGVAGAFADALAAARFNLFLVSPGSLSEVAQRARRAGVEVRTLAGAPLDDETLDALFDQSAALDVGLLVVDAGANDYASEFVAGNLAHLQRIVDRNIRVPLALCHHFGARFAARGRGGIVTVGSLAGYLGHARIGVYAATKAFDRIFAEGLWLELAPRGVHVLHLVLGATRTPAMERAGLLAKLPDLQLADPPDVVREALEHLADGPVRVAGGNEAAAQARSGFPRDRIVAGTAEAVERLREPAAE